jgi:hypothetical protein
MSIKLSQNKLKDLNFITNKKEFKYRLSLILMDKLDEQLVQVVVMQRQIPPLGTKNVRYLRNLYIN